MPHPTMIFSPLVVNQTGGDIAVAGRIQAVEAAIEQDFEPCIETAAVPGSCFLQASLHPIWLVPHQIALFSRNTAVISRLNQVRRSERPSHLFPRWFFSQ